MSKHHLRDRIFWLLAISGLFAFASVAPCLSSDNDGLVGFQYSRPGDSEGVTGAHLNCGSTPGDYEEISRRKWKATKAFTNGSDGTGVSYLVHPQIRGDEDGVFGYKNGLSQTLFIESAWQLCPIWPR
jgi:hypothetical protein